MSAATAATQDACCCLPRQPCLERVFSSAHPPRGPAQVQVTQGLLLASQYFSIVAFGTSPETPWHTHTQTHTYTHIHTHTHTHTHTRIPLLLVSSFHPSYKRLLPRFCFV
jgi:hypothetical protein